MSENQLFAVGKRSSSEEDDDAGPPRKLAVIEAGQSTGYNSADNLSETILGDKDDKDKDGWTALQMAVTNNNRKETKQLLQNKADVNSKNEDDQTALHLAAETNNLDTVELLLRHNANVDATDEHEMTALHWAADNNNHDTVELLLQYNANVNAKNKDEQTALHLAAFNNNHDTVELLLQHNAKVNTKDKDGQTALHYAAKKNDRDTVELLLQHDANVYAKDKDEQTALHWAAKINGHDTVELLLQHDANVNAVDYYGNTALRLALKHGFYEVVHMLQDFKATFDFKQEICRRALFKAARSNDQSLVRKFLENSININHKAKSSGNTILMDIVLFQNGLISEDFLRLFVEFGADLRTRTPTGKTLLHVLLEQLTYGKVNTESVMKTITFLLNERDLTICSRDNEGNSLLHAWAQLPQTTGLPDSFVGTIGYILLLRCSSVDTRNCLGQTPLHLAKRWCVVDLLIQNGAAVNASDADGSTPLLRRVKQLKSCSSVFYERENLTQTTDKQLLTLFENNVDLWIENEKGENIFGVLLNSAQFILAETFVEVVARTDTDKVNFRNSVGETPLHLACMATNEEIFGLINLLLSVTAKPNLLNNRKETPLHVACKLAIEKRESRNLHIWVINLLLRYGASVTARNEEGKSCMDICADDELLVILLKAPRTIEKPSQFLRWHCSSQKHEEKLSQVACGQNVESVCSYYFHQDVIGTGAFSQVYVGINKKDGREVALKRIDQAKLKRPEDRREINNLVNLASCNHLVRYLDCVENNHFIYLVLELMEGTLDDYLNIKSDCLFDVSLCHDVISGLQFLHHHIPPVLHRDIKPGNVLYHVSDRPHLKIADFGLSTKAGVEEPSFSVGTGSAFAGTRRWMAPEVLKGEKKHSEVTDVFSAGLVMHVILANKKHPFAPHNSEAMWKEQWKIETELNLINYVLSMDNNLSPEATDLIQTMVDKDDTKRPHTADVIAHPFFWTKKKKLLFLREVGNQPPFESPHLYPSHQVLTDLKNGLGKSFKRKPWNLPITRIYNRVRASPKSPSYNTHCAVSFLRFLRNTLTHISDIGNPTPMKADVLEKSEFLEKFPTLLMEVYKVVMKHGWDKKEEIEYYMMDQSLD